MLMFLILQCVCMLGLNGAKKHEFMILCGIIVKPIIPNPFLKEKMGRKVGLELGVYSTFYDNAVALSWNKMVLVFWGYYSKWSSE